MLRTYDDPIDYSDLSWADAPKAELRPAKASLDTTHMVASLSAVWLVSNDISGHPIPMKPVTINALFQHSTKTDGNSSFSSELTPRQEEFSFLNLGSYKSGVLGVDAINGHQNAQEDQYIVKTSDGPLVMDEAAFEILFSLPKCKLGL